jgi:type I restriction enzyme S subunit
MTAFIPRQTKVSSEWSYYWMTILDFGGFANPGAVPSLSEGYQSTLPLLTPPVQEQIAVAAFLDRETARIDELVAKKERLITMLQEKRAALITHTVTKGLESNVPMKDSRVGWTEHVPEHWSVAPVYSRYEVQLGKMLDEKQISGKCLAPYLRNVDVQWDRINASDLPLMDFNMGDRQRFLLRAGDLLVCEGGEVGRAAIWSGELEECFYQKALHRVRPHLDRDDPRFLFYLLYAASKNDAFVVEGNQTTIGHLTAEKLRRQRFPFPSRKEQTEIASFLDREAPKIDALIAKVNEAIGRLKEYRTALISTAVTGKIDVREDV